MQCLKHNHIKTQGMTAMQNNYKRKYKLNPHITNKYCENVYNPTVQPDGKTEMGVPIPTTENVEYSKEYEEENEL